MGVFVPTASGHDRCGGEDSTDCQQIDPAGTRMASARFRAVAASAPVMTAVRPHRMWMTSAVAKVDPASGIGRPKISPVSATINIDHQIRMSLACCSTAILQTMRIRLAATAMINSGLAGAPDTIIMVIIVTSMIMHSMAIAMVADNARRGSVSGSQRMRCPVVATVPPAAAIATMISGMTGMAATIAIRPVRQGLG